MPLRLSPDTSVCCWPDYGISRLWSVRLMDDVYNTENESFQQETRYLYNEYSINLPTLFYYNKRWNPGWANVINPFRDRRLSDFPAAGNLLPSLTATSNRHRERILSVLYDYKFDDLSLSPTTICSIIREGTKFRRNFAW